jgi:hypothetical protein
MAPGPGAAARSRGGRAQRQAEADKRVAAACIPTFTERYIDMRKSGWRSVKHKVQWVSSLERDAFPIVGNVSVADINFGHVMSVLEQKVDGGGAFWNGKTETANRVRGHRGNPRLGVGAGYAEGRERGPVALSSTRAVCRSASMCSQRNILRRCAMTTCPNLCAS